MKIWKDKQGNKLTLKEFFSRWKEGINNLTPLQKFSNDAYGTFVTLIGYIVGLGALIVFWKKFIVGWFSFALILIFAGNIWITAVKWLMLRQQVKLFRDLDIDSLPEENIGI